MTLSNLRRMTLSVLARQALVDSSWRESCAPLIKKHEIAPGEVEKEITRIKKPRAWPFKGQAKQKWSAIWLDPSTGDVLLDRGDRVTSRYKLAELLSLPIAGGARIHRGQYWWNMVAQPLAIGGRSFVMNFYFEPKVDVLKKIVLTSNDFSFVTHTRVYDLEEASRFPLEELSRRLDNDDWLAATLGPSPYRFMWGDIISSGPPPFSVKGDHWGDHSVTSFITIRYGSFTYPEDEH